MREFTIERQPRESQGLEILKLLGPFTLGAVFEFQEIVREDPAPALIIDMTDVPYMDSAALGALLGLQVSCQRHSRRCVLTGVSSRLETVFKVAGVDGIFTMSASLEDARELLAGAPPRV